MLSRLPKIDEMKNRKLVIAPFQSPLYNARKHNKVKNLYDYLNETENNFQKSDFDSYFRVYMIREAFLLASEVLFFNLRISRNLKLQIF